MSNSVWKDYDPPYPLDVRLKRCAILCVSCVVLSFFSVWSFMWAKRCFSPWLDAFLDSNPPMYEAAAMYILAATIMLAWLGLALLAFFSAVFATIVLDNGMPESM